MLYCSGKCRRGLITRLRTIIHLVAQVERRKRNRSSFSYEILKIRNERVINGVRNVATDALKGKKSYSHSGVRCSSGVRPLTPYEGHSKRVSFDISDRFERSIQRRESPVRREGVEVDSDKKEAREENPWLLVLPEERRKMPGGTK